MIRFSINCSKNFFSSLSQVPKLVKENKLYTMIALSCLGVLSYCFHRHYNSSASQENNGAREAVRGEDLSSNLTLECSNLTPECISQLTKIESNGGVSLVNARAMATSLKDAIKSNKAHEETLDLDQSEPTIFFLAFYGYREEALELFEIIKEYKPNYGEMSGSSSMQGLKILGAILEKSKAEGKEFITLYRELCPSTDE